MFIDLFFIWLSWLKGNSFDKKNILLKQNIKQHAYDITGVKCISKSIRFLHNEFRKR